VNALAWLALAVAVAIVVGQWLTASAESIEW
jgi:hypothetical protein